MLWEYVLESCLSRISTCPFEDCANADIAVGDCGDLAVGDVAVLAAMVGDFTCRAGDSSSVGDLGEAAIWPSRNLIFCDWTVEENVELAVGGLASDG